MPSPDLLIKLSGTLRDIGQLSEPTAPPAFRAEARRAFRKLTMAFYASKLGRAMRNPFPMFGSQIHYFRGSDLLLLYKEIFVDLEYMVQIDNKSPYIIDCGSNIGMSVLFFKKLYPECKIIGFEPDPDTFATISRNVTENGLGDVTIFPYAVGDTEGTVEFYNNPEWRGSIGMSAVDRTGNPNVVRLKAVRLSGFIDREVDLLKLDVEGAERSVLSDLDAAGKLSWIKNIVMEYHHHFGPNRDDFSRTLGLLEQNGFGYQIAADLKRPLGQGWPGKVQDILVYCFRKDAAAARSGSGEGERSSVA
jgi:FkbM family methyltransferase